MEKDEYAQIASTKGKTKRSSLKNNIIVVTDETRRKSCSIIWENSIKDSEPQIKKTKTMDKKMMKDLQTHFSKLTDESDLYLNKLEVVNNITPTKEVMEEIVEMMKDKDKDKDRDSKSTGSGRKSLKDELSIPKELLKSDEELDLELIEETMKNTLINKVVGKLDEEKEIV